MTSLKNMLKRIPAARAAYRGLRGLVSPLLCRYGNTEHLFGQFAKFNTWGGESSRSGPGSDLRQTETIRSALPGLLRELGIRTLLDIPCGDFRWMKLVDLSGIDYIGADIVADLVRRNRSAYGNAHVTFQHLDLMSSDLPEVDLLFCRDCLVHLSFEHIWAALRNIARSRTRYLLTTTFTERPINADIPTGSWRPLNLEAEPFSLPPPSRTITETCTEGEGAYADKVMALWETATLADRLLTPSDRNG